MKRLHLGHFLLAEKLGTNSFPSFRIWTHQPSLHGSQSDFRQGESAIGIFIKLRIAFFSVHQKVSMNLQAKINDFKSLQVRDESAIMARNSLTVLPGLQGDIAR
jgi:hypothetical protein